MRILKLCCIIVIVILFTASFQTAGEGNVQEVEKDKEVLRHLKTVLWPKAYREQDQKLLDRILADEFQMIDAGGNWSTKKEEMDYISKNKPTYDSFVFHIKRLDVFENGTAVVCGTGIIKGKDQGKSYVTEYSSSNILIKRKGVWKAVASHVSGIKSREPEKNDP